MKLSEQQFIEGFRNLMSSYGRRFVISMSDKPEAIALVAQKWYQFFTECEPDIFQKVVTEYCQREKNPPTISDLQELISLERSRRKQAIREAEKKRAYEEYLKAYYRQTDNAEDHANLASADDFVTYIHQGRFFKREDGLCRLLKDNFPDSDLARMWQYITFRADKGIMTTHITEAISNSEPDIFIERLEWVRDTFLYKAHKPFPKERNDWESAEQAELPFE